MSPYPPAITQAVPFQYSSLPAVRVGQSQYPEATVVGQLHDVLPLVLHIKFVFALLH